MLRLLGALTRDSSRTVANDLESRCGLNASFAKTVTSYKFETYFLRGFDGFVILLPVLRVALITSAAFSAASLAKRWLRNLVVASAFCRHTLSFSRNVCLNFLRVAAN